jgi:methionyl-tRNA formyltransferase
MKIDVAQITDYDSLSLEEKVAALENFEYDDHSDAVESLGKYKDATDKATKEAAEYKKQLKALQDQQKTGSSKADATIAQLQEQVAELTRQNTISSYTAQFVALGYEAELAQATAIATADGAISVTELQLAGKKRMAVKEFLIGFREPMSYGTTQGTSSQYTDNQN